MDCGGQGNRCASNDQQSIPLCSFGLRLLASAILLPGLPGLLHLGFELRELRATNLTVLIRVYLTPLLVQLWIGLSLLLTDGSVLILIEGFEINPLLTRLLTLLSVLLSVLRAALGMFGGLAGRSGSHCQSRYEHEST